MLHERVVTLLASTSSSYFSYAYAYVHLHYIMH